MGSVRCMVYTLACDYSSKSCMQFSTPEYVYSESRGKRLVR